MNNPFLQDDLLTFRKYASKSMESCPWDKTDAVFLQPYMCKCAFVDLFGINLNKEELVSCWQKSCPDAVKNGIIGVSEFVELCQSIRSSLLLSGASDSLGSDTMEPIFSMRPVNIEPIN